LTTRTLAWTGFIALAAFVLMAASNLTLLDPVENVTLNVTAPITDAMSSATEPVARRVNDVTDAGELARENAQLREQNERLLTELARAREEAAALDGERELDAIRAQFPEDTFLDARVIMRDSSNLRQIVAVDRGRGDGLREGMIVVTEGRSLVGTISRVFDDYAWVTLITDPKSAVSALVQESRAEGVVAGTYEGTLNMEFVGQGVAVKEGDFVLTSGVGGGYPAGVVIGRVAEVENAEQDLFQSVQVEHLASLSQLERVAVLTSFEPAKLEKP
jgi:rod shape-determining protein MreC